MNDIGFNILRGDNGWFPRWMQVGGLPDGRTAHRLLTDCAIFPIVCFMKTSGILGRVVLNFTTRDGSDKTALSFWSTRGGWAVSAMSLGVFSRLKVWLSLRPRAPSYSFARPPSHDGGAAQMSRKWYSQPAVSPASQDWVKYLSSIILIAM